MSRAGMEAARQHGALLPSFPNQTEAEKALFAERDALIRDLRAAAARSTFEPDFEPESLKSLEAWYFQLWEGNLFSECGLDQERFERAVAMYVGETVVRNNHQFEWFVSEYVFEPGKYEIGVRKPSFAWMFRGFGNLYSRPNNKRRQSIWREFKQYAA